MKILFNAFCMLLIALVMQWIVYWTFGIQVSFDQSLLYVAVSRIAILEKKGVWNVDFKETKAED